MCVCVCGWVSRDVCFWRHYDNYYFCFEGNWKIALGSDSCAIHAGVENFGTFDWRFYSYSMASISSLLCFLFLLGSSWIGEFAVCIWGRREKRENCLSQKNEKAFPRASKKREINFSLLDIRRYVTDYFCKDANTTRSGDFKRFLSGKLMAKNVSLWLFPPVDKSSFKSRLSLNS